MNTGAKIAIVSAIAVIAIFGVIVASIWVGSINANRERHNQQCIDLANQINKDRSGLKAALGLNTDAINQEISEYNSQCT